MTFRYLLNVSFEGPCSDSSAGSSSAGGGGGGAGGAAASEGRAVDGVRVTAGGGSGGGVVGAGNGEDNRSSAGEPGGTGAGGEVNGTAAVGGLVVSAQGVGVGVFLAAFILTAVAGNLMVILSVACNRHLQTVTNYFIVNLAVADLLLSTTVLPFSATMEVLGFWAFGRAFCDVWAAVDVLCCTASILSLCTISVDRYVGVRHSLKYPAIMTERKAAAILALLWAVALVVSVGPLLGWKEPVPPDERFCGITEEVGYAVFSSLCSFYLPMAVIVVMYCRVYVVARSTTRSLEAGVKRERGKASEVVLRIHCRGASTGSDGAHGGMRSAKGHTFRSSLSVRLLKFSREKKAAKTLAIVVGVFVLCWFPFFFVLPLGPTFIHEQQSLASLREHQQTPEATCFLSVWKLGTPLGGPPQLAFL
ncbi:alpha-1D adrenergic receptor isoform X3 [Kogia breviceps]|uniref:alpha-1D adrenergic receptor isoform X3 n=1 Tax=Kogia breviceps TaxID=27615 RepID=UPI0034D1D37D